MSTRKPTSDTKQVKRTLSGRLAEIRSELFGNQGKAEMARRLGIPPRSWYNYEGGVTVPAEVILKTIELTSVEPLWLLHGTGPKYRRGDEASWVEFEPGAAARQLIRTALELAERQVTVASSRHEGDLAR